MARRSTASIRHCPVRSPTPRPFSVARPGSGPVPSAPRLDGAGVPRRVLPIRVCCGPGPESAGPGSILSRPTQGGDFRRPFGWAGRPIRHAGALERIRCPIWLCGVTFTPASLSGPFLALVHLQYLDHASPPGRPSTGIRATVGGSPSPPSGPCAPDRRSRNDPLISCTSPQQHDLDTSDFYPPCKGTRPGPDRLANHEFPRRRPGPG